MSEPPPLRLEWKTLRTADQLGGSRGLLPLPAAQHTCQTSWIKRTMEVVAGRPLVSLSQQAARQLNAQETAGQLSCTAALPTFVSGLLSGDRDDMKAGQGASRRTSSPVFGSERTGVGVSLTNSTHRHTNAHTVTAKLQHPWNRRSLLLVGFLLRQQNGRHKCDGPTERSEVFHFIELNGVIILCIFLGGKGHYLKSFF